MIFLCINSKSDFDDITFYFRALQLDNEARTRQDYSHYRVMMRSLRRSEENYHDNSKIAYLIQVWKVNGQVTQKLVRIHTTPLIQALQLRFLKHE